MPKRIVFSGYAAASQPELLTAAGLQNGTTLGQPEMQAATQKLSDTGLFSDIRFSFNGTELHYTLTPAVGSQTVSYSNFPWWDDKALTASVAAKVPLFHGMVIPESGLQQQVAAALTELVKTKGVEATILAAPHKGLSGKDMGVQFAIESPAVQIGPIQLAGASTAWGEGLGAIEKAANGQDFNEATGATLEMAVRAIYHRQGYLDVALTNYGHGEPQLVDGKVKVPVGATIVEGAQYRLASLKLSGDVLMTPDEFAKRARLHAGDVANEDLLRATLEDVSRPYQAKGYLEARVSADPVLNHSDHTVDYSITVTPGPVFHMGKLTLLGLDPEQLAAVEKYWTLHEGDVYDATYPPGFLAKNKNTLHVLDEWSASYKRYEKVNERVVDLVVTFRRGGSLK